LCEDPPHKNKAGGAGEALGLQGKKILIYNAARRIFAISMRYSNVKFNQNTIRP
jgi:hypothetical protein